MKKYLLAVLALGATMMVACNPDDNKGGVMNRNQKLRLTTHYQPMLWVVFSICMAMTTELA